MLQPAQKGRLLPDLGPWAGWLLVAAAARIVAAFWAGLDLRCSYDECSYLRLATALASGEGWLTEKGFLWPPGYPLFVSRLLAGSSEVTAPLARLAQALLGSLLVLPVAALCRRLLPPERLRFGVHVACALVALDPTLVAYSHLLWPETLFLLALSAGVLAILASRQRPAGLLGAGALLGAAGLIKALGFWLAPGLALAAATGGARARLRAALLVLAGALLVVLPWTARNMAAYGRLVLIDATAGTNMALGNSDAPPVCWDWGAFDRTRARDSREACREGDFVQRDRCERGVAAAWIAAHPLSFLRRALTKWADLVQPTSFLVRQVRAGRYQGLPMAAVPAWQAALVTLAVALPWVALALLSAVGLARGPAGPERRLTLALLVTLLAVHALTFGMSRFRLPAVPLLAAWAAVPLAAWRAGETPWPVRPASRLALAAALAALTLLWSVRLGPLLDFRPFVGL